MKVSAIAVALTAISAHSFTVPYPASKPMTVLNADIGLDFEEADGPILSAVSDAPKLFGIEVPDFIAKAFNLNKKKEGPIMIADVENFTGLGETGAYLNGISYSRFKP